MVTTSPRTAATSTVSTGTVSRRTLLASTAIAPAVGCLDIRQAAASPAPAAIPARRKPRRRLTNLAHLDELCSPVKLRPVPGHTTYRLAGEPTLDMLWVYADVLPDGGYKPVGGGAFDAAANTWGQGAYDVDDIARAAVVYLRHWKQFGDASSRRKAYQQLRAMAYFQTLDGAHAGEYLLWMQPDGTLNPSPTPADDPNPADSDDSYWTARCVWALGEGHAAFRRSDPAFAAFLAERMELTLKALRRDVEGFGSWQLIHGVRVPGWFITNGADATSEAVLGLAAYVRSSGSRLARELLSSWAHALAAFQLGSTRSWPYRALMPWGASLDNWHAWGASMTSALAAASRALGDRRLLAPAVDDAAGFTPHLLTSTGPVNGLMPLPVEKVQIAYGADCRVRACHDVGQVSGRQGLLDLAGIAAGWFFGANNAGVPAYVPATGVTYDGIEADGRVNRNSGAESTIHGLLTMLVLDSDPRLAALALASAKIHSRNGLTVLEAEDATLGGGAVVKTPDPAWTGESLWSGKQVEAAEGGTLRWELPQLGETLLVQPVAELLPGTSARTAFRADGRPLGQLQHGRVGRQGEAEWEGRLTPVELGRDAPAGSRTLSATVSGGTARLDAVMVMPEVATLLLSGAGDEVALLTSKSRVAEYRRCPIRGKVQVRSYDARGQQLRGSLVRKDQLLVAPGGFTVVTRGV